MRSDGVEDAYRKWCEQQIATQTPGVPFVFCGDTYHVEVTDDQRRIVVAHTDRQLKAA